ncbi:predicted protein [Sclerotinia sclerotiorum 1980 UF-70]|uniref:Uncharacterized protein n=1 Tax=Sclerotinia sclerotiorum (strain ATCC 18683 / 1980 / Ss-1) TaxID=665079 RepID=A7F0T9_SCLS1|nr:predicted protein [Sclerotinia sclerotiorum 1980 UF-70]EDN95331.1 predicted protein [Sclerotinia sclerotiorum 1980 UF-70]
MSSTYTFSASRDALGSSLHETLIFSSLSSLHFGYIAMTKLLHARSHHLETQHFRVFKFPRDE